MADSKSFSMEGWNFWAWLKGNKESIKLVLAALFGLWVPANPALKVLMASALKLLLDSIDFFVSTVEL